MHAVLLWPRARSCARSAAAITTTVTLLQLRRRPQCDPLKPCSPRRTSPSWPPSTAVLMDKRSPPVGRWPTPLTARVRSDVQNRRASPTDAQWRSEQGALPTAAPSEHRRAAQSGEWSSTPPSATAPVLLLRSARIRASSLGTSCWLANTVQKNARLHAEDVVARERQAAAREVNQRK